MVEEDVLKQFGTAFMGNVRDRSISDLGQILNGTAKAPMYSPLIEQLQRMNEKDRQTCTELVLVAVDSVLADVMSLFEPEHEDFFIGTTNVEGQLVKISDLSDGLQGELYTTDGWVQKFSAGPFSILTR